MKHIPFFNHRHKESLIRSDKIRNDTIYELDRLEGMFIRLRNLSILGKERTKISDREKRIKMEGYVEAFAHAAAIVGKAKKNLQRKQDRNQEIQADEMHESTLFPEEKDKLTTGSKTAGKMSQHI